jgi:hypothetical protein
MSGVGKHLHRRASPASDNSHGQIASLRRITPLVERSVQDQRICTNSFDQMGRSKRRTLPETLMLAPRSAVISAKSKERCPMSSP